MDLLLRKEERIVIDSWNTLIRYLAAEEPIEGTYDLAILAGNSLPYLADELYALYQAKRVKQLMLVGGIGHATSFLQKNLEKRGCSLPMASEAEMYYAYIRQRYSLPEDAFLLEKESANSGENASAALAVVKK